MSARPEPPELDTRTFDDLWLVRVEGMNGHAEHLVPQAAEALEAGALVVYADAPEGLPASLAARHGGRFRVRIYRWNGPAWYAGKWCGRGEWYATAYVGAATRRGTVNVYLGRWRAPGARIRAANGHVTPPPLSPEGIRRAVARVTAHVLY